MLKRLLPIGLAGLLVGLSACTAEQVTSLLATVWPSSAPATGRVSGRVLDEETRQPVPGALIAVGSTAAQATSGSDGTYEVTGLPAGILFVKGEADGYLTFFGEVQLHSGTTAFDVRLRRPVAARRSPAPSAVPTSPASSPASDARPLPSPIPLPPASESLAVPTSAVAPVSDVVAAPVSDVVAAPSSEITALPAALAGEAGR